MTTEQKPRKDFPVAFASRQPISFGTGDRLLLILRSIIWSEQNVAELTEMLDGLGLEGRYGVIYLDPADEAHVIRAQ